MKRLLIGGVALSLLLGVVSPVLVFAQQNTGTPAEINARVEKRKAKYKTQLTNAEAAKISERCKAAQEKLAATTKKIADTDKPIQANYETHATRIQKVLQKAEVKGLETAELKKNVDLYNEKYQAMLTSVNDFNVSTSDLKAIDCKANPTGFKASLQSAREELKLVQSLRKELSELTKGPLLTSIKAIKVEAEKN